ncbi:hypothetical protein, partial [Vibrio vulnificus]|uniref:hypothetical protein n=1 Tax=Vibrio vulnificus TaxID=672 RepID=UPI0019D4C922
ANETAFPIMRIHRHGRQRKASARSGEVKASEKINLKKCLTLQINSLECTSALREKFLEKQSSLTI